MFSCGYNGWADVPEEEREALDAFESSLCRSATTPVLLAPPTLLLMRRSIPARKAA